MASASSPHPSTQGRPPGASLCQQKAPGAGVRRSNRGGAGAVRVSVWLVNPLSVGLSFWFGRFDTWLSSRLKLPPSYLLSYSGNYTDDAKSWRLVDITRLTSKYRHDQADKRICTSLLKTKTCSLERALRRTHRFQKWLRAKRLTPDLVQVRALQPLSPTPAGGAGRGSSRGVLRGLGGKKGSEGDMAATCRVEGEFGRWPALSLLPRPVERQQPHVPPAEPTCRRGEAK